jgi:cell division protein FtsQ
MWRKVLNIISWVLIAAYIGVSLWFTEGHLRGQTFKSVRVIVADSLESQFIQGADITSVLSGKGIRVVGSQIENLNRDQIKSTVKTVSGVKDALVYSTPDGILWITVWQRRPIMRYISPFVSFYIDTDRKEMPLSDRFSAPVMVVTGDGNHKFLIDSLFYVVDYITRDEFLNALISEINVNPDHTLELVPRIGDNRIFMGDASQYDWKLTKLKVFFDQGMPNVGWDKYSRIDLAYSNQVVARKWTKEQRKERDSLRIVRDTTGEGERREAKEERQDI